MRDDSPWLARNTSSPSNNRIRAANPRLASSTRRELLDERRDIAAVGLALLPWPRAACRIAVLPTWETGNDAGSLMFAGVPVVQPTAGGARRAIRTDGRCLESAVGGELSAVRSSIRFIDSLPCAPSVSRLSSSGGPGMCFAVVAPRYWRLRFRRGIRLRPGCIEWRKHNADKRAAVGTDGVPAAAGDCG